MHMSERREIPIQPDPLGDRLAFHAQTFSDDPSAATPEAIAAAINELDTLWFEHVAFGADCLFTGTGRVVKHLAVLEAGQSEEAPDHGTAAAEKPKQFEAEHVKSFGFNYMQLPGDALRQFHYMLAIDRDVFVNEDESQIVVDTLLYVNIDEPCSIVPVDFRITPDYQPMNDTETEREYRHAEIENRAAVLLRTLHSADFRLLPHPTQKQAVDMFVAESERVSGVAGMDFTAAIQYAYHTVRHADGTTSLRPINIGMEVIESICLGLDFLGRLQLDEKPISSDEDMINPGESLALQVRLVHELNTPTLLLPEGLVLHIPIAGQDMHVLFQGQSLKR